MAAFNFPASPSNGDTYTLNSVTYQYDGTKWVRYSASVGSQGSTGPTVLRVPKDHKVFRDCKEHRHTLVPLHQVAV